MDSFRLVGIVVVAYLGVVFVFGSVSVVSDVVPAFVSFVAANATHPVVVLNAALAAATVLIVGLARRKR